MDAPLVTIIIPTFRAGATLQASLDSVLGQDLSALEVLIMDGGSKDNTAEIALRAAEKDARVRFLSAPDKGVYDAMNKGILEARGKWLYFLGSDDSLYNAGVLSVVLGTDAFDKCDVVYGNVVSPSFKGVYDGEFDLTKLLRRNISHQAIFYRKSLFERIPPYDLRYKGYADWDLNIRLFTDGQFRFCYTDHIIANFGPDGLSSRHDEPFLREVLFPQTTAYLRATGLRPLRRIAAYDECWRLIRNARFPERPRNIPLPLAQMAAWQERIPYALLKKGVCSKMLMFASYCRHLLTGALK